MVITAQEKNQKKPIALVAGGAGFIGSFLCEALLLHGCQVICLDNFSTGKKENLKKCLAVKDFIFYKHDLNKPFSFQKPIAYIFHLSGLDQATKNLLILAKKTGAKFLEVRGFEEGKILSLDDVNGRIVLVFDVYGPRMNLGEKNSLVQLIKAAILAFPLKISGQGLKKIHPLFISDVVYGIAKAMFATETVGETFALVNHQGMSLLDFARQLQKQSRRKLKIEFVAEADHLADILLPKKNSSSAQKRLNWQPEVKIKEGIWQTLKFFESQKSSSRVLESKPTVYVGQKKVSPPARRSHFLIGLVVGLLVILSPFLLLAVDVFRGGVNLKKAHQAVLRADLEQVKKYSAKAQASFARAEKKPGWLSFYQGEKLFYLAKVVSKGLFHLGLAAEKTEDLVNSILQEDANDLTLLTTEIGSNLDYGYQQFALVESELKANQLFWPKDNQWLDLLPEMRDLVFQAKRAILLVPRLVGLNEKKTYLILLQNNHELRPTGGFIGSFGLATFDRGKLVDFETKDVYSADGQLKGHVEPPEALKKYLGEANWFLRDSNWDPDFASSAKRAAWFLEKETGRVADGVLGINLFLAQEILEAVGEIQLLDFEEKINAANLFERAEYYSEVGFFPGSTQKKDFLASLTRTLFEKLKNGDRQIQVNLFKALYRSLETKELLVWLDDAQAMKVINEFGWDGTIGESECQLKSQSAGFKCLTDYLMIVEANLGVNKANYFVKRKIYHQIDFLKDGLVKKRLEITYQNKSSTEVFPGGNYKNYLRILTPLGSQLEKILIDKKEIDLEKVDKTILHAKTCFGFLVEVPIRETRSVEIFYRLPGKIDLEKINQYAFLIQKQSGIKDERIDLWLNTPPGITILPVLPQTISTTQPFSSVFDRDIALEVSLVR